MSTGASRGRYWSDPAVTRMLGSFYDYGMFHWMSIRQPTCDTSRVEKGSSAILKEPLEDWSYQSMKGCVTVWRHPLFRLFLQEVAGALVASKK